MRSVIFVSSVLPPSHSGAAKRIYTFFEFLLNNGVNATIITLSNRVGSGIFHVPSIHLLGIRKLELISQFLSAFSYLLFKIGHFKKEKNNKLPAIWLLSANPLTFASSIVFKLFGFKIITQNTLLGSDDPAYKYPQDFLGIKYWLKRLQYRLSDLVLCNSPALLDITSKYHQNVILIPNPVDINITESKLRLKRKNVLSVGRISYRKGSDILLRTIDHIHKIDNSIQFTVVGPSEEMDGELKSLFDSLKNINHQKIKFTGYIDKPNYFYENSDLFFLPTRREGFPSVFIEAMSHGLPVVCKKIQGITDYILGFDNDLIIDSEDSRMYGAIILKLLNDDNYYQSMVDLNNKSLKRFEKSEVYSKYVNAIHSVYE